MYVENCKYNWDVDNGTGPSVSDQRAMATNQRAESQRTDKNNQRLAQQWPPVTPGIVSSQLQAGEMGYDYSR